jgi:hypothetical protein
MTNFLEKEIPMSCSSDKKHCKSKCLKIGLMVVVGIGALGGVVMLLWNWLVPSLFVGAQPVGYWQALGILLLSKILFGGFRGCHHGRWRERQQRWESMSEEERAQLKGRLHGRWSGWCGAHKSDETAAKDGVSKAE